MAMDPLPEEFVCVEPLFKRRLRMRQAAAPKETKAEIAQQRAKAPGKYLQDFNKKQWWDGDLWVWDTPTWFIDSFFSVDFHTFPWFSSIQRTLVQFGCKATERILIGHRPAEPAPQERPWLIEAAGNIFESTPVRSLSETTSQRLFLAVAPELEKKVLTEGDCWGVFVWIFFLFVFVWVCTCTCILMVFYFNACFLPNFDDEDVETRTGDDRNDSLKELRVDGGSTYS